MLPTAAGVTGNGRARIRQESPRTPAASDALRPTGAAKLVPGMFNPEATKLREVDVGVELQPKESDRERLRELN